MFIINKIFLLTPFLLIPYFLYLIKNATCGWDCGFYIYHLSETNNFIGWIEPLYFWLFKPLNIFGSVMAMKISMILMLILLIIGLILLAKKYQLNDKQTFLVIIIVLFSLGTIRLWSDTLRNFLVYSLTPLFIYFYISNSLKSKIISYLLIILMLLTHRMVLIVFPIMFLYNIINQKWKTLIIEIILILLPAVILYTFIRESPHQIGGLLSPFLSLFSFDNLVGNILTNINLLILFAGMGTVIALISLSGIDLKNKDNLFIVLMFMIITLFSIFSAHLFAGRTFLILSIPISIIVGLFFKSRDKMSRPIIIKICMSFMIIIYIISGLIYLNAIEGSISYQEKEFIDNISLPENTILLSPSRLYYYTKYSQDSLDVRDVEYYSYIGLKNQTKDTADVYRGLNKIGNLYFIDTCDHFKPNITCPLNLKYSEV